MQTSSESYIADTSVRNAGRFIPPGQSNPTGSSPSDSDDKCNQTVFHSSTQQKSVSTGISTNQESNTAPAPTDTIGAAHTLPKRNTQVGGTQTSPPPQPKKNTAVGCTQTTPS